MQVSKQTMKEMVFWGATGQAKVLRECMSGSGLKLVALFDNNERLVSPFADVPLYFGKKGFEDWIGIIEEPHTPIRWQHLEKMFGNITHVFQLAKQELNQKISLLDNEERNRLNEAFNCYIQELNYSSIVMSVSAIESRLFSLMTLKQPKAKIEKFTLGDLIREYLENKERYGNIIPDKHLPLLQYCNTYRVFSVHPKKEKINRANATIILCMTCSFLFDKNLKAKIEK